MTEEMRKTTGKSASDLWNYSKPGISLWLGFGVLAYFGMMLFYYLSMRGYQAEPHWLYDRRNHINQFLEDTSVFLPMAAAIIYWLKALWTRNMTYVVLAALCASLLLRELHWSHEIKVAIYPLLAMWLFWGIVWGDIMDKPSENPRHSRLLFAALFTFFLSQLVEKKVFKFMPYGNTPLHTQYEEVVEFSGHLLIFLAAVFANIKRKKVENVYLQTDSRRQMQP
ncbi:MAG TPA: hypothetical protein PLK08_09575 [Phycisphaerae bacterium]|nr:hypothetical protein [Phycisphaerae bacterium]